MTRLAVHSIALLALAGCLEVVGQGTPPECQVTTDCNHGAGEVCEAGVCWGDPPERDYVVVVGPPPTRPDLAPTAHLSLAIADDGWAEDLEVSSAAFIRGRLEAICDGCPEGVTVAATITVRRAPLIPGGAEFIATAQSTGGVARGESFSIAVPRAGAGEPSYQVTIEPSTTATVTPDGPTLAELIPPLRFTVAPDDLDAPLDVMLAAGDVQVVDGRIVDDLGAGVAGMRVRARGRVDPLRPLERVSTIATTDAEGWFRLVLGADALDIVDIVASPPVGVVAPTVTFRDRFVGGAQTLELRIPIYPEPVDVTVPIVHVEGSGDREGVPGVRVELRATFETLFDPGVEAELVVDGYTDADGVFAATVIGGTTKAPRGYRVRVYPPATSLAASFSDTRLVGATDGAIETVELAPRTTLTGQIVDATGRAVDGVTVAAVPSLSFLWSLESSVRDELDLNDRETPNAVTNADGSFALWVDPAIVGQPATYDLDCEPPELANVPRWTIAAVDAPASKDLGYLQLPDAAHIRASVVDPQGVILAGAAVRVYELGDAAACVAENAPENCEPPAVLRASGQSDANGIVHLVLPRI